MPLPHPPGDQPPRQSQIQIQIHRRWVLRAGGGGAWDETLRQLAAVARTRLPDDLPPP